MYNQFKDYHERLGLSPLRFCSWLKRTKDIQEGVFGYDFDGMDTKAQAEYLFWNTFAAQQELAELAVEFSWKPWAVDKPFVNRDRVIAESVDVLHFVGNSLVAVKANDEELNNAYEEKVRLNIKRHDSGVYSAQKGGLGEGSDLG